MLKKSFFELIVHTNCIHATFTRVHVQKLARESTIDIVPPPLDGRPCYTVDPHKLLCDREKELDQLLDKARLELSTARDPDPDALRRYGEQLRQLAGHKTISARFLQRLPPEKLVYLIEGICPQLALDICHLSDEKSRDADMCEWCLTVSRICEKFVWDDEHTTVPTCHELYIYVHHNTRAWHAVNVDNDNMLSRVVPFSSFQPHLVYVQVSRNLLCGHLPTRSNLFFVSVLCFRMQTCSVTSATVAERLQDASLPAVARSACSEKCKKSFALVSCERDVSGPL